MTLLSHGKAGLIFGLMNFPDGSSIDADLTTIGRKSGQPRTVELRFSGCKGNWRVEGAKTSIYPRAQRQRPVPSLKGIDGRNRDRKKAMVMAYETGAYSYQQIGKHFGVHFTTVGRVVSETKEKPMSKRSGI